MMEALLKKPQFDELPLPVLLAKTNGRLFYANTSAKQYGITQGDSMLRLMRDSSAFMSIMNGECKRHRITLTIRNEHFSADLVTARRDTDGEAYMLFLITRIEPLRMQDESIVMASVCEIFAKGAKQPINEYLHLTAQYAGAFYAALYEKTNGRYMIKGEWRQRRSVCVPILSADFEEQTERELTRLKNLKSAYDIIHVPYAKSCGTWGAVLYFFDNEAGDVSVQLEKFASLFKTFMQDKPRNTQTSLMKGLSALAHGFAVWDATTLRLLYANKAYMDLFGNKGARMISEQLRADLQAGSRGYSEYTDMAGRTYAITHQAIRQGRRTVVTTLISDVTKYKLAEQRLEKIASTDVLTGLLNRRAGLEKLETIYKQCKTQKLPLTVCFADIDGLKHINDMYGHGAGDKMIRLAADVLNNHVEDIGFVCRLGGDEFVIILPGFKTAQARLLAVRMEKAIEKSKANGGIALSFGFTEADYTSEENADMLISDADVDMYKQKRKRAR